MFCSFVIVAKPLVEKFVKDLRTDLGAGAKIGATGYCWGGRYALLLADGQVELVLSPSPFPCFFLLL